MKFTSDIAVKNIIRKPFRTFIMMLLVMFLSLTLFVGAVTMISLRKGLMGYRARLGADIVVVPSSATGHGSVDDIFLQGITGNYYMNGKLCQKVLETEGIESATTQFFLTSAKASCCSTRVQIIGFDPETDFSITPWIKENYSGSLSDGELIVGADLSVPEDRMIKFYGRSYHVAAQLEKTGTGLDSAVYTNISTIRQMAEDSVVTNMNTAFDGINIDTAASAILIKVADGYEISDVADDINIHITKVEATPARDMISSISEGLGNVSGIIGILMVIVWILAVVILVIVFTLLSNERKKEFAVLRISGASRKMLFAIMAKEAVIISFAGAVFGILIAIPIVAIISGTIKSALSLPFLMPDFAVLILIGLGAVVISVLADVCAAAFSAGRITGRETGLLIREDA